MGKLLNAAGELIVDKNDIRRTWKEYVEKLFYDEREDPPAAHVKSGPSILVDEIKAAIKSLKERKTSGPDEMQSQFLKFLMTTP